jgi:hypothetical protein
MSMKEIRIGELGKILTGSEAGRFVEVVDDAENTGGFLIVTYADAERAPDVNDAWVGSVVDVELYFEDAGWEVQWLECG